ncbi:hypothetical protein O181_043939 [Austropuccinia psidii MF-1]|uniref:Uncharacterized protein n=1 Tax=Austropuccinia psidii MF-1 TaxID=1389203 RepID=A0A9Q3DJC1_9BASI|nr:hypothetical protein [Austropuccinia psidii MF-1]
MLPISSTILIAIISMCNFSEIFIMKILAFILGSSSWNHNTFLTHTALAVGEYHLETLRTFITSIPSWHAKESLSALFNTICQKTAGSPNTFLSKMILIDKNRLSSCVVFLVCVILPTLMCDRAQVALQNTLFRDSHIDSQYQATFPRLRKRRVIYIPPGVFWGPPMLAQGFETLWTLGSNPDQIDWHAMRIDSGTANDLHQIAFQALSETLEDYASQHQDVSNQILTYIRFLALEQSPKLLKKQDQEKGKEAEKQLHTIFSQNKNLEKEAMDSFQKKLENLKPVKIDTTEEGEPDEDFLNDDLAESPEQSDEPDWAHRYSSPNSPNNSFEV